MYALFHAFTHDCYTPFSRSWSDSDHWISQPQFYTGYNFKNVSAVMWQGNSTPLWKEEKEGWGEQGLSKFQHRVAGTSQAALLPSPSVSWQYELQSILRQITHYFFLLYDSVYEHTFSFVCSDLWTMAITQQHIHNSHPSHDHCNFSNMCVQRYQ
jgi:hypothetical protein